MLYSKTHCLKDLKLRNSDISHVKYLFNQRKITLYDASDITNIIARKFESLEKHKIFLSDQHNKLILKNSQYEQLKQNRRGELIDALSKYKLEFKNYGDCYNYVHYGKPTIAEILRTELHLMNNINKRRAELFAIFNSKNIIYNESLHYIKQYLYQPDNMSLDEIVNRAETDMFFIKHTNYLQLLEHYNEEDAKEIALAEFASHNKTVDIDDRLKKISNKLVINFDNF